MKNVIVVYNDSVSKSALYVDGMLKTVSDGYLEDVLSGLEIHHNIVKLSRRNSDFEFPYYFDELDVRPLIGFFIKKSDINEEELDQKVRMAREKFRDKFWYVSNCEHYVFAINHKRITYFRPLFKEFNMKSISENEYDWDLKPVEN